MKENFISAIILAAGQGTRVNMGVNKTFLELNKVPIIIHTLRAFKEIEDIDEIILVIKKGEKEEVESLLSTYNMKVDKIVYGGRERQDSFYQGLKNLDERTNIVLSQDGARPFVKRELIIEILEKVKIYPAVVPGIKPVDTIKILNDNKLNNIDRDKVRKIQTPQAFQKDVIISAYNKALSQGFHATDDSAFIEKYGGEVHLVEGDYDNIKITRPIDLMLGELILKGDSNV